MRSLRRTITLALAGGFTAVIVASGLWTTRALARTVTDDFDDALLARARGLAALTEQERGHIELDYTPENMPEFEREAGPEYFQFWLDDGKVLMRSRRLTGDLPRLPSMSDRTAIADAALPDGRPGRVAMLAFVPKGGAAAPDLGDTAEAAGAAASSAPRRGVFLSVARGRDGLDALVARMRWEIAGAGAVAALLAALLVWRVTAAGMRPIDAIAAQVSRLDADRLSARVLVPRTPRELEPVVRQLNALLERVSTSLERERRFAGNVAHELRTPIAELRSLAAVGAKWPDDPAAVSRFFADVGEIAGRMGVLVADLLLLARCHAGVEGVERVPTPLRPLLSDAWAAHAEEAAKRELRVRLDVTEDVAAESDPGKLAIVFGNLVGNAVVYARAGTEVRCVGSVAGGRFRVEVANAAEALSKEDLARLTEPFWRGDAARTSPDHAGIGLSLVAALASLLGLAVRFDQGTDGEFRVQVEGPAAPHLGGRKAVSPPPANLREA